MQNNNNYLIAGSTALKYWIKDSREPKDLDVFYIENTEKPKLKAEFHAIPKELFDLFISENNYLTLESLYVLKLSHAEYNIHWEKTIQDILYLENYVKPFKDLDNKYHVLYNELKTFWKIIHKDLKKNIKFNKPKDEFFNERVKRYYDHDYIHCAVAYYAEPLYTRCLKQNEQVLCDENNFKKLTHEEKIKLCREEISVLALERLIIPKNYLYDYIIAYRKMLKRLVTEMSKGWFSDFIIQNIKELLIVDRDYVTVFRRNNENEF